MHLYQIINTLDVHFQTEKFTFRNINLDVYFHIQKSEVHFQILEIAHTLSHQGRGCTLSESEIECTFSDPEIVCIV